MYKTISRAFNKANPLAPLANLNQRDQENEYYFELLTDYGIKLNEQQKAAVKQTENPLLIVAGAGSGKTMVLTSRIGYMIHTKNINPKKILLVTYTKKASIEMIERLARIPGIRRSASREVVAGTYHSICLRILREEGYDFKVLSSERKQNFMIKMILKSMRLQDDYETESILSVISGWKSKMRRPNDIDPDTPVLKELKTIYEEYEKAKEKENLLDFDDLCLEAYYLLKFNPQVLQKYQSSFEYVMCDEFQDSSRVQYEIIRMLAAPHNNLCVVGDDAQTIYGFRAASAEYMLNFHKFYPDCLSIILDVNYRSNDEIVGLANDIIKHNQKQIFKTLQVTRAEKGTVFFNKPKDANEEAKDIVDEIKQKQSEGESLKDIAILYRTHATGRAIFDQLVLQEIPFVQYGKKTDSFYQNTFVKPIIALLRLMVNQMDTESLSRISTMLYISTAEMESTIDELLISYNGNTPSNLATIVLKRIADRKNGYQKESLIRKIESFKVMAKMRPIMAIREIRLGEVGYERMLELDERKTITTQKDFLKETLDEAELSSRGFETIKDFISFIDQVEEKNEDMESLRNQPDLEAVRLMTIHASKGLEFDTVFSIGLVEKVLPHISSLEAAGEKPDTPLTQEEMLAEERRLAYVCLTRAKKELFLSSPENHRNEKAKISRFIKEGLGL